MDFNRIKFIDTARGIAIILVILGHIHNLPSDIGKFIYAFHMPTFFFIS